MAKITEITDKYPLLNTKIKVGKIPVTVKSNLSSDDFVMAVHTIADTCFTDEGYRPEYQDIVKPYVVLKYFTDIDLGEMSVDEVFKITQNAWYSLIEKECFNCSAFNTIELTANKLIDYRLSTQKTSFDEMCDKVKSVFDNMPENIDDKLEDVKTILDNINKVDKDAFVKETLKQNLKKDIDK